MGADGFGTGDFAEIFGAGGGGLTGIGFGTCGGAGAGGGDFAGVLTFGGTGIDDFTSGDAFVSRECFKLFIALIDGTSVGLINFGASGGGTTGTGTEAFAGGAFGCSTSTDSFRLFIALTGGAGGGPGGGGGLLDELDNNPSGGFDFCI